MADKAKKENTTVKQFMPIGLTLLMVFFTIISSELSFIQNIERSTYDYRMAEIVGSQDPLDDIVIIAIDDQSYEAMNLAFPWPRRWYKRLIENLNRAGARLILFDIQFDAPSKDAKDDSIFAAAVKEAGNVILVSKPAERMKGQEISSTILPIDILNDAAYSVGSAGIKPDADGIYRSYYIGINTQKTTPAGDEIFHPTLSVEAYKFYLGLPKETPLVRRNNRFFLGNVEIPFKPYIGKLPGTFNINFRGPKQTFKYYSFYTILDDSDYDLPNFDYDEDFFDDPGDKELGIPAGPMYSGVLKDKLVYFGATFTELYDNKPTPFSGQKGAIDDETPGVEVHANALNTLIQGNYIEYIDYYALLGVILLLGMLVYLFISNFSTGKAITFTIGILILYLVFNVLLFRGGTVLEFFRPIMVIFLVFTANYVYQYLSAQKEKAMIKGAFAHYVPAKVVDSLIDNPDMLQLGGEEREMTVLFSDVAGFTTISENLTPQELVHLLNMYLTAMTDLVLLNDGIIDKYEGDAIMAEWGAPIHFPDHAFKGVHAAILMQRKLDELRPIWQAEGYPPVTARIGLNTGTMVVGNMGSREVFDYTVMGDAVNLASRLEGANKPYKTNIMISETTYEAVKDKIRCRELDFIQVKGKTVPIRVYEVVNHLREELPPGELEMLQRFEEGLGLYRNQEFQKAMDLFEENLRFKNDDGPSELFRDRCFMFLKNPPAPDWDGVFTMTTK